MNNNSIVDSYNSGNSMRSIAEKHNTNHKLISRILKREGVETRKPLNMRGKRKFECDIDLKYNNMVTHLKWDVGIDWARQYCDFDKLKFLNRAITNRDNRYQFSTEEYKGYIEKFYYDKQFNIIYEKWAVSKVDKYLKPSIDHIIPKSKGGTNSLENLQFLTWFENRCKNDMTQQEWVLLKNDMSNYII